MPDGMDIDILEINIAEVYGVIRNWYIWETHDGDEQRANTLAAHLAALGQIYSEIKGAY